MNKKHRFFHGTGAQLGIGQELIPQFKSKIGNDVNASIKIDEPMYISARDMKKVAAIYRFRTDPIFIFSSEIDGVVYELENNADWYYCGADNECHYRNSKPVKIINKINFNLNDLSGIVNVYKMKKFKFGTKKFAEWRIKKAQEKYTNTFIPGFKDENSEESFFKVLNRYAEKIEK